MVQSVFSYFTCFVFRRLKQSLKNIKSKQISWAVVKQLGCGSNSSERIHPHKVKDFISLKGFEQPKSSHTSQKDGPNHNPSHKIKTFADIKCLLSERSLLTDSYLNIIIVLPAFSSLPGTNSNILLTKFT